jgi:hypothetical protein
MGREHEKKNEGEGKKKISLFFGTGLEISMNRELDGRDATN